jgi:hypothetical protein
VATLPEVIDTRDELAKLMPFCGVAARALLRGLLARFQRFLGFHNRSPQIPARLFKYPGNPSYFNAGSLDSLPQPQRP